MTCIFINVTTIIFQILNQNKTRSIFHHNKNPKHHGLTQLLDRLD